MAEMQFGLEPDPELEPKRTKTLLISIGIHIGLLIFLVLNPDLLVQTPKRTIRIAGQDYDLSKEELTPLVMPPTARPKPQVAQPTPQTPPPPQQQAATQPLPPPPPPPPPKPKETPPAITPDMVLAAGAKLDGTPKASRGSTPEIKAGNNGTPDSSPKDPGKLAPAKQEQQAKDATIQTAQNTNPNAIRMPDLLNQAGRIVKESIEQTQKGGGGGVQGPHTGLPGPALQENPDFSAEEPTILSPTYGYDFGPYLNQVITRIRSNWISLIPEIAKFRKGRVMIIFTITKTGIVAQPRIVVNSGETPLDRAAFGSITASNPFPRIPNDFVGDHIDLQITFLYNINPK
jgi:TonB family protein